MDNRGTQINKPQHKKVDDFMSQEKEEEEEEEENSPAMGIACMHQYEESWNRF